jgi:hypothetical protein
MHNTKKILALATLACMAGYGHADNDNYPDWNAENRSRQTAQVTILDETNSIDINGNKVHIDDIDPRMDISGSTGDTGIGIRRAGGTDADFGGSGWYDGGVESVGKNGVIGASTTTFGVGVLGISVNNSGKGIGGYHTPSNGTDSGIGVYALSSSSNGVGIIGENTGGGLAGSFKGGDVVQTLPDNGIVKGWAKIASDGSIVSCYKCDTDTNATEQLAVGSYIVSFSPLGADISARPRSATLDTHISGTILGEIGLATSVASPDSIFVKTADSAGVDADKSFTVIVY